MIALLSSNLADLMSTGRPMTSQPLNVILDHPSEPISPDLVETQPQSKSDRSDPMTDAVTFGE